MPPGCLPHLSHLSQRALIWSANLARSLLAPPSLCSMTRSKRLPALSRRWKTVAARAAPSLTWWRILCHRLIDTFQGFFHLTHSRTAAQMRNLKFLFYRGSQTHHLLYRSDILNAILPVMDRNQMARIIRSADGIKYFFICYSRIIFKTKRDSVCSFRQLPTHNLPEFFHLFPARMVIVSQAQFRCV